MESTLVGRRLIANMKGISKLPVERRTVTAYDDIREESSSYSFTFAENDPADGGQGLLRHTFKLLAEDR